MSAETASAGSSNLQILVDCFDDIPSIMSKMNVSLNDSPTRFKGNINIERNNFKFFAMSNLVLNILQPLAEIIHLQSTGCYVQANELTLQKRIMPTELSEWQFRL